MISREDLILGGFASFNGNSDAADNSGGVRR